MAKFRIGQRVKLIAKSPTIRRDYPPIGTQGVIVAIDPNEVFKTDYGLQYDGFSPPRGYTGWGAHEWMLAPLQDDKDDVQSLGKEKLREMGFDDVLKEHVKTLEAV